MIISCASKRQLWVKRMRLSPIDPSSYSRPDVVVIKNIDILLTVDLERKIFHGSAELVVTKLNPDATEIEMDSKDLRITAVYELNLHKYLNFYLNHSYKEFGSKLIVELPPKAGKKYNISIRYETSPNASGLHWVKPEHTFGRVEPFVYSYFSPIHARSFLPCQDTPSVRITYRALITVPNHMTVIMSSPCHQKRMVDKSTTFYFNQAVPIPVYLIAVAVGVFQSKQIGPRSYVWGEKEIIGEMVANKFIDVEKQLEVVEQICGPYVWKACDILILPPIYPYDTTAHPCLIYVPYVNITSDRIPPDIIVYKVVQSWIGSLLIGGNFEHSWLSVALSVFIGRKVIGSLSSLEDMDFFIYCGNFQLIRSVNEIGYESPLTCLVPDLSNRYPSEYFTDIPYEKGYIFLRYLEVLVGGPEIFERFLRLFFEIFKSKAIESEDFQSFFEFYFINNKCTWEIDWKTWLYTTGMPPVVLPYNDTRYEELVTFKKRWLEWEEDVEEIPFKKSDLKYVTTVLIIQLLEEILEETPQPVMKLEKLNKIFKFNKTKDVRIKYTWLRLQVKAQWFEKVQNILYWINTCGNITILRTLYKDLYQWEEIRERVVHNFRENSINMSSVCVYYIIKDLKLERDILINKKKYLMLKSSSYPLFSIREEFTYCCCRN